MSVLVPPMSNVTMRSMLAVAAIATAAVTPEAGPDRIVSIGRARAVARPSTPPFDAVMKTVAVDAGLDQQRFEPAR